MLEKVRAWSWCQTTWVKVRSHFPSCMILDITALRLSSILIYKMENSEPIIRR